MKIDIDDRVRVRAPVGQAFAYVTDIANLVTFAGCGPIPGIARAEYARGSTPGLGAQRIVSNTDGTRHRETCTVFEAPCRYATTLDEFQLPLSLVVRRVFDTFSFSRVASETEIVRSLAIDLVGFAAYPAALPLIPFLRRAIAGNLETIKSGIEHACSASGGSAIG
jgi:hypothetical protein